MLGMELWNAGIGHKHSTDSNDTTLLSPVKLRCTNPELLSALGAAKDTPLIEECGSDTRSISHHVCDATAWCACIIHDEYLCIIMFMCLCELVHV